MATEDLNTNNNTFLTFKVDDKLFAVDARDVENIHEIIPITPVPLSPDYLKGVFNLRGSVLPIFDTPLLLHDKPIENIEDCCIIVLNLLIEGEMSKIGALVDEVEEVIEFSSEDILPQSTIGAKQTSENIKGVINYQGNFIYLIDIDKTFGLRKKEEIKVSSIQL